MRLTAQLSVRACPAVLAALALLLLGAASAGARLVKLPGGGYANLAPLSGSGSGHGARNFDSAFNNLDYSGGPVMASNANYTVVWQPSNHSGTGFQPGYVAGVNQYFTDLAAANGSPSVTDAVSSQYNDASGATAAFASTYAGSLIDTDPLPASNCPANEGANCLTDAQLQSELDSFLSLHGLPHDLAHEYFLLTPPDLRSCIDSAGSACSANSVQNAAFCAYHSQSSGGYVYSNIPDLAGVNGCDPFVSSCPTTSCQYNNGPADGVLSAVSHEHIESITDPQPNSAWTDFQPGCGPTSPITCGGEIGDKCNADAFSDPHIQLQPAAGQDTPYNQTINGHHYLLQMEWSNQAHACLGGFTTNGSTANAAFTDSPGSSLYTVNFDASASVGSSTIAEYVWQFNDGPGQTATLETTTPLITHTFPGYGTFQIALTVMTSDGTSSGTAATLDVGSGSSPVPAFGFSPGGAAPGTPISFDAGSSTDPNSGGAIASYNWNFGDGATTTAVTPQVTHTYASPGAHTVTLTVTDTAGLTNSASRTLVGSGQAPTAAFVFSPGSPQTASAVWFDASSSSASTGPIRSYTWSMGDGATASGRVVSHVYASAGSFDVTLTVTGSDGETSQVTHTVTVVPPAPPPPSPPPTSTPPPSGPRTPPPGPGPVRCVVPRLSGKTLSQATRALHSAHCNLGGVRAPRAKPRRHAGKHRHWVLVVVSTSAQAARSEPKGSLVSLTLGYRAVRS